MRYRELTILDKIFFSLFECLSSSHSCYQTGLARPFQLCHLVLSSQRRLPGNDLHFKRVREMMSIACIPPSFRVPNHLVFWKHQPILIQCNVKTNPFVVRSGYEQLFCLVKWQLKPSFKRLGFKSIRFFNSNGRLSVFTWQIHSRL